VKINTGLRIFRRFGFVDHFIAFFGFTRRSSCDAVGHINPIPFLQNPISTVHAPFVSNPSAKFPDFPQENVFSQAHFLWQSHTFCQRDTMTGRQTGRMMNPPEEQICSLKKTGLQAPIRPERSQSAQFSAQTGL
jgi:hypothetical protein